MPKWYSSYEQNSYGDLFYALTRIYKPQKIVELGTRAGYSAYHMARGLKDNEEGTIDCYDLWEDRSVLKSVAQDNLKEFSKIVNLELSDALEIHKKYKMIDMLHVDLDNDGEILEEVVPHWLDKVRQFIIIEGGSVERDQLASQTNQRKLSTDKWLNDLPELREVVDSDNKDQFVIVGGKEEYKEKPIVPWLKGLSKRYNLQYLTIDPFPSITIIRKK